MYLTMIEVLLFYSTLTLSVCIHIFYNKMYKTGVIIIEGECYKE